MDRKFLLKDIKTIYIMGTKTETAIRSINKLSSIYLIPLPIFSDLPALFTKITSRHAILAAGA